MRSSDWVAAAGLVPTGPLRVLYLQFGAEPELRVPRGYLVHRDADFVTELQHPGRRGPVGGARRPADRTPLATHALGGSEPGGGAPSSEALLN